eukprot:658783-Hanusia_phi.AAC.1
MGARRSLYYHRRTSEGTTPGPVCRRRGRESESRKPQSRDLKGLPGCTVPQGLALVPRRDRRIAMAAASSDRDYH